MSARRFLSGTILSEIAEECLTGDHLLPTMVTVRKNSGQIAIFVLLVMLLGLTIGLSITSRTIQDLRQSEVTDQSSRAFTAAEAGVESVLSKPLSPGSGSVGLPGFAGTVSYTVTASSNTGYAPSSQVAKDDVVGIDLSGYGGKTVTVFWNKKSELPGNIGCSGSPSDTPASLELTFYSNNGGVYSVAKYAYNDNSCQASLSGNGFSLPSNLNTNLTYNSQTPAINVPTGSKILFRIRPIYNNASILVTGDQPLPPQSFTITSKATSAGGATRAVQVTKTNGTLPPIFDYVLFSGQNLSQ